jgi:cytochrome oxidase Cu insertion factor (SCO1/SenC/PrrC family)
MNKIILLILSAVALIVVAGCGQVNEGSADIDIPEGAGWRDVPITDVVTGEIFTINSFEGKPVLIESFAVWCPTCLKQQQKIQDLIELEGDSIEHVSLDTDPNEDSDKVKGHVERHGFTWPFVVSPKELTQSLIDEFGIGVVNAPSSPVVVVCPDQSAHLLKTGVKSAQELKDSVEENCG